MKTYPWRRTSRVAQAFTLVELLVVIFILTVLAGILVPSVNAVRTIAKQTATGALLNTLGSGLDMFKSESNLGRNYPPSGNPTGGVWDMSTDGSPYSDTGERGLALGGQLLVWALAGADLLGTPGFKPGDAGIGTQNNGDSTYDPNVDGLYARNGATPVAPRYGPFIDLSKVTLKSPSETKRPPAPANDVYERAPFIVDSFDMPVLYFAPVADYPANTPLLMYDHRHNSAYLKATEDPLYDSTKFYGLTTRDGYILDKRAKTLTGINFPCNRDSYLLITAGPDRYYGTKDDAANFPFKPQE